MQLFKKIFVFLAFVSIVSCNSAQNTNQNSNSDEVNLQTATVNDYTEGKITSSFKSAGCNFIIEVNQGKSSSYFDPINLDDKLKVDGKEFWFTYTLSRSAMRCANAQPIIIEDIKIK